MCLCHIYVCVYITALPLYEQAIALYPEFGDLVANYASQLEASGRISEAKIAYARARELMPHSPLLLNNLGWLHEQQGEYLIYS